MPRYRVEYDGWVPVRGIDYVDAENGELALDQSDPEDANWHFTAQGWEDAMVPGIIEPGDIIGVYEEK